ncbi:MAG: SdrD B-like domain-containing protein [Patescibacteria group bacterium]|jgi:hypothetical protein
MSLEMSFFRFGGNKNNSAKLGLFLLLIFGGLFGYCLAPVSAQGLSSISGLVFEDLNLNKILDLGEKGAAGFPVALYQGQNLVKTSQTDDAGYYYFGLLEAAGNYQVKVKLPNGWQPVKTTDFLVRLKPAARLNLNIAAYQISRPERGFGPMLLISNISVNYLSADSIKIIWFTTHAATSQVVFGESSKTGNQLSLTDNNLNYPLSSGFNFETMTYHSVILTGLRPGATYYYRIVSLADPKQWRGAARIFSSELNFTMAKSTGQNAALSNNNPAVLGEKITKYQGNILANGVQTETNVLGEKQFNESKDNNQVAAGKAQDSQPQNCQTAIWLIFILNAVVIAILRTYGQRTANSLAKKLWWLVSIIIIVPLAMGYPQCWLTVWLLVTLFLALILLSGFRKKRPILDMPENFSPFNDE